MEFLKKQGEGLYAIGLGSLADHDRILAALKNAGVGIEMQGVLGNDSKFTILETVEDLGCRVEFSGPARKSTETYLKQTGVFVPTGPGIINMDKPILSGGKRFTQVGIVLKDEKKSAQRYEELFGIRGWRFSVGPDITDVHLDEILVPDSDVPSFAVGNGNTLWGDMQMELLRPVGMRPGGCHQRFFDRHGNGFQHLNIGPRPIEGYQEIVDGLNKVGIIREFNCVIRPGAIRPTPTLISYFAMEAQLGGFVLEMGGSKE